MKRHYLFIIFMLFLLIFQFFTLINGQGSIPDCELVATCDTTKINQGDNFELKISLVGSGKVVNSYFCANSDRFTKLVELSMPGTSNDTFTGNFSSIMGGYNLVPKYHENPEGDIIDVWRSWKTDVPYVLLKVETFENITFGDHDITVSYFFKDENDVWHHSSKIFTFHVNTWTEHHEQWIFLFGSLIVPILLTIIGLYVAFYIHRKNAEMKKNTENNITHNIAKTKEIKSNTSDSNKKPNTTVNKKRTNK